MLTYAKLALGLVKLLNFLIDWGKKRQYMAKGKAELLQEQLKDMENEIRLMRAAADAVIPGDRVQMENDPDDRANWPESGDRK